MVTIYAPDGEGLERTIKVVQTNMNFMMFMGTIKSTRVGNTPTTYEATTETIEIQNYPYILRRSGSDLIIVTGGCPGSGVIFNNWKVSNQKPTTADGETITAFSCNKSGNRVIIKGKTRSEKSVGHSNSDFEVIIDLSSGTIQIKESSFLSYTTMYGGNVRTTNQGTLYLQSDFNYGI